MRPSSGVPPGRLYYGSIVALLLGTALAVVLFIQPSETAGDAPLRPLVLTPTAPVALNPGQPGIATTPPPGGAPTTPLQASPTQPAAAAQTPTPTRTAAAGTAGEYTVVAGDTLSSICERVKPAAMSLSDCIDRVVSLNNLSGPNAIISVGQRLSVPQ